MKVVAPIDANGRVVMLGDWVRVIQAPLSIIGMQRESVDIFTAAIGHTFQVHEVTQYGCLELLLYKNKSLKLDTWDSIYLEAFCCVITRRPRRQSAYFKKHLAFVFELDRESGRPEWRVQP
jgi:hypothetical protein